MSSSSVAALVKQCLDRLASELTGGTPKTLSSVTGSAATRELRDALQNALYHCQNPGEITYGPTVSARTCFLNELCEISSADPFWYPFKLACQPSQPHRMREVALDGLQKLIAYKLLRGSTPLTSYVPLPPPPTPSDANHNSVFQTFANITGLVSSVVTGRASISGSPAADHDLSSLDASSPVAPSALISNARASTILQNGGSAARTSNVSRADSMRSTTSLASNSKGPQLPSNPYLIDEIIHTVCTSFNGFQSDAESSVQLQVLKVLLTAVTSTGCCEVHEISLLKVVQTCFNIHIHSRSSINSATAKATLTQMVNLIFSRMERYAEVLQQSIENGIDVSMFSAVGSLQDVILTPVSAAALDLPEPLPSDPNEGSLRVVNDDEKTLASEGIKTEEDVDDAKSMVLQALNKICEDPQTLADLFLNYDCELAYTSLFERIVSVCAKVASTSSGAPGTEGTGALLLITGYVDTKAELIRAQERRLKMRGLCCLVAVVNSLVRWSKDVAPGVKLPPGLPSMASVRSNSRRISMSSTAIPPGSRRTSVADDDARSVASDGAKGLENLVAQRMPDKSRLANMSAENTAKSFLDALAPTNQNNPIMVVKHPLYSVLMSGASGPDKANGSHTSLLSTDDTAGGSSEQSSEIEKAATKKQILAQGIRLFTEKPKKGIKLLIDRGIIQDDPEHIARFLRDTPGLSKSAIGDFIGENDPRNIKTMHAFIDSLDFDGLDFVSALRFLLQTFRLPGEAQKIDRIVEKFADRFCENNSGIFAKADAAYTLAFSVIMLNTDQHSRQIKHRMDKPAFIKNNRGINDNADLPDAFLGAIFDEIQTREIIMEEEHAGKMAAMAIGWGAGDQNERIRMEFLRFEGAGVEDDEDLGSSPLASVAGPAGAANEPKISDLCLQGFASAIHLAAIFRLETERDAFVSSLAALTGLQNLSRGLTPRAKNVKSIRVLLYLANSLGEYLDGSWVQVMRVVSLMERLHVTGRGAASIDGGKRSTELGRTSSDMSGWVFTAGGGAAGTIVRDSTPTLPAKADHHAAGLDRVVAELNSQQMVVAVDRIFSNTVQLSATAIIHFFRALCQVSLEEVGLEASALQLAGSGAGQPRMYLLQKIVEIAYYNMHRIRFEWSQIWRIIQPYFNAVASHPTNVQIATFGVDSLRQLTMKFLERDELAHYATQNDFLKSFEAIMKMNNHVVIRELILSSLSQMITARANSIRSGWKSIFVALARTVEGEDEVRLVKTSFVIVQQIFREHFDVVVLSGAFVDFVNCLAEFALLEGHGQLHDEIVMGSIQLLQYCTKHLTQQALEAHETADGKGDCAVHEGVASSQTGVATSPGELNGSELPTKHVAGLISEEHFYLKWFPILSAESRVIVESESLIVRTRALDALFEIIRSAGHMFEIKYWRAIYRSIIFPIFEDLRDEPHPKQKASREATFAIWIQALRHMGDTVTHFFDFLAAAPSLLAQSSDGDSTLVRGVLELMVSMLQRKDEKLATTGEICLQQFLISNVHKFDETGTWSLVTDIVVRAFAATLPAELLACEYRNKGQLDELPAENIIKTGLEAARAASAVNVYLDRTLHYEYRENIAESASECEHPVEGSYYLLNLDTLDFEHVIVKCGTHLELIQTMRDVALILDLGSSKSLRGSTSASGTVYAIHAMPPADRARWFACLYDSYAVARAFNSNYDLRYAIWKRGLVQQMPNLVKQETIALATYLQLLFAVYPVQPKEVGHRLAAETSEVLERFSEFITDQQKNARDIALWSPVVVLVFREIMNLDWTSIQTLAVSQDKIDAEGVEEWSGVWIRREIPRLYSLGVKMMMVDRPEVRQAIQVFLVRVGQELLLGLK
ncbi:hypothetical protein BJ742DRAFT_675206 [Cladochytrium replicatum]|nr:hypothetical protein BJ742DRAFT_675206 [Cladochytrium replicatum]